MISGIKKDRRSNLESTRILKNMDVKPDFEFVEGVLYRKDRLHVPDVLELKNGVLIEARRIQSTIPPKQHKDVPNLKSHYWWNKMKRDIAESVSKCVVFQQTKIEDRKPPYLLHNLEISKCKMRAHDYGSCVGLFKTRRRI